MASSSCERLPSFIVTLATLFIISGFSAVLTSVVTNITYIPIDRAVVAAGPVAGLFNWSFPVGGGAAPRSRSCGGS